ncbi:unnamed protein product [Ascophyllum nodosum]
MGELPIVDEASRVNVYIYDDPALDFSDLIDCYRERYGKSPWQDERADTAQDMGEIWLHRAMLDHPWRVLEPDKADVFYVPMYPVLSYKLMLGPDAKKCRGLTHNQRIKNAVAYLHTRSVYFQRFGGGDHVVVCAWWKCGNVFTPWQRMLLRRVVLGINERHIQWWANWGCGGRLLTIPYTASSIITTPELFGGADSESRDIPFFFVGTARKRPERQNLKVVQELYPTSVINLGDSGFDWVMNATQYANHITRSKFCFCPRGDTLTSRRVFDAVAAGCIPVLVSTQVNSMPFVHDGLDYKEFSIVAPAEGFDTRENVTAVVDAIMSSRSSEDIQALEQGLQKAAMTSMVYGLNEGLDFEDMRPLLGPASRFLSEVWINSPHNRGILARDLGNNLWRCERVHLDERHLSPRTFIHLPPPENSRSQWLSESETIINTERSLLFCAPPNAGSLQFRMLAKRMKGVEHWAVSNDPELLFDPAASELSLLDVTNASLMNSIYKDNDGGWIKIGVVRDPVTRLVSSYLGYFHLAESTRSSPDGGRRGLRNEDLKWFEGVSSLRGFRLLRRRGAEEEVMQQEIVTRDVRERSAHRRGSDARDLLEKRNTTLRFKKDPRGSLVAKGIVRSIVPTFSDLVEGLEASMASAPTAFRPISTLCGMMMSPFDSVIPFENLQKTSTEVLKSLPGGVWDEYGTSGWGPNSELAFMEFDYGSVLQRDKIDDAGGGDSSGSVDNAADGVGEWTQPGKSSLLPSSRARDLFEAGSCDWTRYYTDEDTLKRVGALYSSDYRLFGWYDLDHWIERLRSCLGKKM